MVWRRECCCEQFDHGFVSSKLQRHYMRTELTILQIGRTVGCAERGRRLSVQPRSLDDETLYKQIFNNSFHLTLTLDLVSC